jgi:hypothetical protein
MQFQVPQFIEVEDKIFGPFTFKQFIYVAGSAGLGYMLWRAFPLFIAAPLIMVAVGFGAALAFLQLNGRPFILALEHGFYYLIHTKLYLWDAERSASKEKQGAQKVTPVAPISVPKLTDSKLHELAWSLDIKDRIEDAAPQHSQNV